MGAMPVAVFLGREGGKKRGRENSRQLATAVLKTSNMLLGGIKGRKNQTLNKAKQPNRQKKALREVSGTVHASQQRWAERKETNQTHYVR